METATPVGNLMERQPSGNPSVKRQPIGNPSVKEATQRQRECESGNPSVKAAAHRQPEVYLTSG
jgi:hypothetical protein